MAGPEAQKPATCRGGSDRTRFPCTMVGSKSVPHLRPLLAWRNHVGSREAVSAQVRGPKPLENFTSTALAIAISHDQRPMVEALRRVNRAVTRGCRSQFSISSRQC